MDLSQSLVEYSNYLVDNADQINGNEVLLTYDDNNRFVLFPIENVQLWDHSKKMVSTFWVADEIDFKDDMKDWEKLSDNERHFIKYVIAFFAGSDGIVNENLALRFMNEVKLSEAKYGYTYQLFNESVHSETYSLLIDTYIKDTTERKLLFNAINDIPVIKKKANWALKWITNGSIFAVRLIAFAIVEGVFFSGSFCSIYWLKKRGKMPGLTFSNELISRDEGLHTDFACLLFNMLTYKPKQEYVHLIIREAVKIEQEFITEALPCSLIGMNSALMSQYIEFVADRLLLQLGYEKVWNSKNPFDWMELISLKVKTNFFEKKVSQYAKTLHTNEQENTIRTDTTDADF